MKHREGNIPINSGEVQKIDSVATSSSRNQEVCCSLSESRNEMPPSSAEESTGSMSIECQDAVDEVRNVRMAVSNDGSPWYQLRKEAAAFVSHTLQRGRKNLWQLTTSRLSVLLSSAAASSTSIHQFLKNYEDLNVFILAGEAFCGVEATEFRQKLKGVCENYFVAFHRQNIYVS